MMSMALRDFCENPAVMHYDEKQAGRPASLGGGYVNIVFLRAIPTLLSNSEGTFFWNAESRSTSMQILKTKLHQSTDAWCIGPTHRGAPVYPPTPVLPANM